MRTLAVGARRAVPLRDHECSHSRREGSRRRGFHQFTCLRWRPIVGARLCARPDHRRKIFAPPQARVSGRWGATHHPKTDVVITGAQAEPDTVSSAGKVLNVVPRPAAQHPHIRITSVCIRYARHIFRQTPFPHIARHIQHAIRTRPGRILSHRCCPSNPTFYNIAAVGIKLIPPGIDPAIVTLCRPLPLLLGRQGDR